jgi:hypothetical protein
LDSCKYIIQKSDCDNSYVLGRFVILQYSTKFIPDEDGDWEVGLNLAGRGNLFLDEKLIIDLSTDPAQGENFFGMGTVDMRAVVKDLKAGQAYELEVRLDNASFISRGTPFFCRGGMRLGGFRKLEEDDAIAKAVHLAKGSDGMFILPLHLIVYIALLCCSCNSGCWPEPRVGQLLQQFISFD